ncbi:MAG TPA: phosphatidylglycerophosphatase A [Terriglobales bacterium]|nr:phosphatidylglycerophosphatase A [Terriglobales bacterium]
MKTKASNGGQSSCAIATEGRRRTCSHAPLWAKLAATFFCTGLIKPGPGTWASAATALLWFGIMRLVPLNLQLALTVLLAGLAVAIGIPAATRISRASGLKDPGFVVIDEVAGQLISFIAVAVSWQSLLLGFILFRGFDIVKPPPLRMLERLPDGVGIVVDDMGAGIYALIVMQVALHLGWLPR